jgi:natural product precursor
MMKKLKLNLNIQKEILTKEQMRKIYGGSYSFTCYGLDQYGNHTGQGTIWAANCCDAQAIADHDAWNAPNGTYPYGIDCPCDMDCN